MFLERNTRQRLLELVIARLGWVGTAQRLQIDAETLGDWMSGATRVPDEKLAPLVNLIDETNGR
jgi:hypothetical protein